MEFKVRPPYGVEHYERAVWDSSIVISKYFERWPSLCSGKRCVDLSAGCGLVGLVLACLGASVVATDLAPNLPLLQSNFESNGVPGCVVEHRWGSDVAPLQPPFDIVTACDVMYVRDCVSSLVDSLVSLSGPGTLILVAHGRNRQAEAAFLRACAGRVTVTDIPVEELHPVYSCNDVRVCRLLLE